MSARLAFPYRIDAAGHTAAADVPDYVESLVRLVLQTDPGERVNRPDFGGGLKALVFMGMDASFAAVAETLIRGVLLHWLGDVITIATLRVTILEAEAQVTLIYTIGGSGRPVEQVLRQGLSGASGGRAPVSNAAADAYRLGRPLARIAR